MKNYRIYISLLCLVAVVLVEPGCEERDIFEASDAQSIESYVSDSYLGRSFFRTEGLIPTNEYTIPGSDIVYSDSVIEHLRFIEVAPADSIRARNKQVYTGDWPILGSIQEAIVTVEDEFMVVRRRVGTPTPVADTALRRLKRFGFMMKLGNDADDYLGWLLRGFNSIGSLGPGSLPILAGVKVLNESGSVTQSFPADDALNYHIDYAVGPRSVGLNELSSFIAISSVPIIGPGNRLELSTETASPSRPTRYFQLVSAADSSGEFMVSAMPRLTPGDLEHHVDTVFTPVSDTSQWNLMFIQVFNSDARIYSTGWCVPYRIPQK